MYNPLMESSINQIRKDFELDLKNTLNTGDFDSLYLKYFSKTNGEITKLMKLIPSLPPEDKKKMGPLINSLADELKLLVEKAKISHQKAKIEDPTLDITILPEPTATGYLHPITQVIREMNLFFKHYGFSVAEGPEIETPEYNFRKLNLPENHPATDLQDTLYIKQPELLLRTHTSSVEARFLTDNQPPIRIVVPGKVYRNETANKSNSSFFHQYQGAVVDKGVTIKHLKGLFTLFLKHLYGEDTVIRFRYKYYPEVSPGLGTDIQCPFCKGSGCETCKQRGWIEVLGSGMIHYNTLKMCSIDPEVYTGFAWGMGLDRLVMAKFGIRDIRKLYGGGMIYL